jgi:ABC-type multidrug transport system fused ATPase/permease subunit
MLSVLVPAAVVATVMATDWISGLVILVALPLIPLFAVIVGLHTKAQTRRQWRLLAQLSGHFLDVVQGLPTLKVFGRARAQEQAHIAVGQPPRPGSRPMSAPPAAADLARPGRPPLLRLLAMARPLRGRLLLAVAAGAAATGCGVALLAVSGFLLSRASQHPSILAISAAVVAVRALSIGRGVCRYLERLASHDVAFRVLAQVRVAMWRRLAALAPAGLPLFRSGDLLARLISDVDGTQDLFIRGITPLLTAVVVGGAAVTACLFILAPGAAVLAGGLLAAGIIVPLAGAAVARRAAQTGAPARGRLAATVTDLLDGAADLQAFGAEEAALAQADAADARRGPRPAAAMDQIASPRMGYPSGHPRGDRIRGRTAAPSAGPRVSRRPGAADPRRAHRSPRPRCSPGAHRGPAAGHRRPRRSVHHPRTGRAQPGRPHRGARPRQGRRTRQPPRAPLRGRALPADVGKRANHPQQVM